MNIRTSSLTDHIEIQTSPTTENRWLQLGWALVCTGAFVVASLLFVPEKELPDVWFVPLDTATRYASIALALLIFLSGWNYQGEASNREMVIAYGFLAAGILDFAHALSAPGMPSFVTLNTPEKEILLWLSARGLIVLTLLARVFLPEKRFIRKQRGTWLLTTLVMTAFATGSIMVGDARLPDLLVLADGSRSGLGTGVEILIALILTSALVTLFSRRATRSWHGNLLTLGIASTLVAELLFFIRTHPNDIATLFGHAYTVVAAAAIYRLIHLNNVRMPYLHLAQLRRSLAEKERFLETLITEAPDGVLVAGESGRIEVVNKQLLKDFGYTERELVGQPVEILLPPEMHSRHVRDREAYAKAPYPRAMGGITTTVGRKRDGGTIPVEISLGSATENARRCVIAFVRNVAARKRLEDEKNHLLAVLEESPDWIFQADRDIALTYANPAARHAFDIRVNPLDNGGKIALTELFDHVDLSPPPETIFSAARRIGVFSGETHLRAASGRRIPVSIVVVCHRDAAGEVERYSLVARDVSERVSWEQQLEYNATHDSLTGLPNRLVLTERIEQAIDAANRGSSIGAIMFLDLDNFKLINDNLGHRAGDEALISVALRLQNCLRQGDTLARFGGDEFVVIAPGLRSAEDAAGIARKLLTALDNVFILGATPVTLNASIGICLLPQDAATAEAAMSRADQAMYRAKRAGRGHYQMYASALDSGSIYDVELASALKEALRAYSGELALHYQPQVRSSDGAIVCIEALLRWNSPRLGQVSPARFIPLAEETGLILELGEWILSEACEQLAAWREKGIHTRIAVNISVHELKQANFAGRVQALLDKHHLEYDLLELEVTETALINNIESVADNLNCLRALGVRIALDDFGTGYSSLAHLRTLPVDKLKIDREFVNGISTAKSNQFIVAALIRLAGQLELDVIAEGVETPDDLAVLADLGCNLVQGWLLYRPMPGSECMKLMCP